MVCNNSLILRTNYVGRVDQGKRISFTDWLIQSMRQDKSVMLYGDVFFNPLHATDLCMCIEELSLKKAKGLYNLGSRGFIKKLNLTPIA